MDPTNQMPIATKGSNFDISKESLTAGLAKKFSKIFKKGDVIFLYGEIGVGKTTFVKYLINNLQKQKKISLTEVTSPTFSLLNEYKISKIQGMSTIEMVSKLLCHAVVIVRTCHYIN